MKKFTFFLFLVTALPVYASIQTLPDDKVDSAPEVSAINSNFQYLNNGKLDLKPGDIIPRTDSLYYLGSASVQWKGIYVDTVTATAATFTGLSVSTFTCSSCTFISARVVNGLTAATVDTGQGANELYDMNQNVQTTDTVAFSSLGLGGVTAPALDLHMRRIIRFDRDSTPSYGGFVGAATTADFMIESNRNPSTGALLNSSKRGAGIDMTQDGTLLLFTSGTNGVTKVAFMVDESTRVHIQPVGTADVELEVSDGLTTGGGDIHRATSGTHSRRALKHSIKYLADADYAAAYNDLLSLRHVTFKYKTIKSTATMETIDDPNTPARQGLIYEEAPQRIKDGQGTIILDYRVQELEMALIWAIRKIEKLEKKVKE